MRVLIISWLLICLGMHVNGQSSKKTKSSIGLFSRVGNGITGFSDIKKDKFTSDHYRIGGVLGLHYTKIISTKFYFGIQGGISFYNKYKLKNVSYEEYSYPLELHGGYRMFKIWSTAFEVRGIGGVQRFIQYSKPEHHLSNSKNTENRIGYGFGIGLTYSDTAINWLRRSRAYLMYIDYGKYKFCSITIIHGIGF